MNLNLFAKPLFVFLLFQFLLPSLSQAVESTKVTYRVNPFIRNFSKSEYRGANQNWSVSQDSRGIFYFGNTFGLLEFNGNNWSLYPSRGNSPVRSTYSDTDGKIYYGTYEDFGYYERDDFGVLHQNSLKENLSDKIDMKNNSIWTIDRVNDCLYFHSFRKIFVKQGNTIKEVVPGDFIFSFFLFKQKPYFCLLNEGLFYLDNNHEIKKEVLPENVHASRIKIILPLEDQSDVIVTEFDGLYLRDNRKCEPWDCPVNKKLENVQINKAIRVNSEQIAIGTISRGLFIINNRGEILYHLDKSNGLQDNTILSLLVDLSGNLWVGMDKGIDFVELNSPFVFCYDQLGILGSVYCSALFQDKLYIGTNHGLFCSDWKVGTNSEQIEFKTFPQLQGQVWNLEIVNGKLICSFNTGILQIEGDQPRWLSDLGGYQIVKDPQDSTVFYQGTYTGISKFKQTADRNWKQVNSFSLNLGGIKSLQFDYLGNLWCGTEFKGLLKIQMNEKKDSIISKRLYAEESGFHENWNVGVFKLENRIVFTNNGTFYTYDYANELVTPYAWLNNKLGKFLKTHCIFKTGDNEYWFGKKDELGMYFLSGDSLSQMKEIKYSSIHASSVDYYENIRKITHDCYLLGLDNGFAIYDSHSLFGQKHCAHEKIVLNSASCSTLSGSTKQLKIVTNSLIEIPNRFRKNIVFNFSIPGRIRESYTLKYKLDDNEIWSEITPDDLIRFNYLNYGSHVLNLTAEDKSSPEKNRSLQVGFTIFPPWYLHWIAFVVYLSLIGCTVFLISKLNRFRMRRHKLAYLKNIKTEHTRRIQLMKEQNLEKEIKNKSKELVNYTILLRKKNEVLQNIQEILNKDGLPENKMKSKVLQIVDQNLSDRKEWEIFRLHFDEAHSDFLKKLKSRHPDLTPNDLRFCAFLRMNMTSKEISILLNMSLRSIEVKRYRLRLKLGLEHDHNLVDYIMTIE